MKLYCMLVFAVALLANAASAASTINAANKYSYGANVGWIDCRGDTNNGAVIGEYVCSGFIYSANVGWISLGNGSPTNGIQYLNTAAGDFGVNQDGLGNLRGYAYGANIGWINFENTGAAKVDLLTGKLSGYAYSANCGWISLSNAFAFVQTDTIPRSPDSDASGLPDAWERTYFGHLGVNPKADADGDGMSNLDEYFAGTNPTNASDALRITTYSFAPGGTLANLTWTSVPTRYYYILRTPTLSPSTWGDTGLGLIAPDGLSTTRSFSETSLPVRFFRVQAVRPLTP